MKQSAQPYISRLLGAVLSAVLLLAAPVQAADFVVTPHIVNGLNTQNYPTTGVLLNGSNPSTASLYCSGTMIGCDTFMTAAHCVCATVGANCQTGGGAPNPANFHVFLQNAGTFSVSSIKVRTDYNFPVADVAIVKLAQPVTGIRPTPINETQSPLSNTTGTIVGFGRTGGGASNNNYGIKRFGEVMTATCTSGISNTTSVCWEYANPIGAPGTDSNTCNGDSGGPMFINFGSGDVVAGVTSGGSNSTCLAVDRSYDTNVYHYRDWINTEGGSDLSNTSCGAIPQVGDADSTVFAFSGNLSSSVPSGNHSFTLPAGTSELRVAMNGIDDFVSNFNIYVKAGSPATSTDFDCASINGNQYEYCEFDAPAAGEWHVLVQRLTGAGDYQLTATAFTGGTASGIAVTPGSVGFGSLIVNTSSAVQSVTVENIGSTDLDVLDIQKVTVSDPSDCDAFNLTLPVLPATLTAGATLAADVSFTPTLAKNYACDLRISSDDAASPELVVPLTGEGLSDVVTPVVDGSLSSSTSVVNRGGSFPYSMTLTNTTNQSQTVVIQVQMETPIGTRNAFGPLTRTFGANATLTRNMTQRIPAGAPAGTYTMVLTLEDTGGGLIDEERLSFTVQ